MYIYIYIYIYIYVCVCVCVYYKRENGASGVILFPNNSTAYITMTINKLSLIAGRSAFNNQSDELCATNGRQRDSYKKTELLSNPEAIGNERPTSTAAAAAAAVVS